MSAPNDTPGCWRIDRYRLPLLTMETAPTFDHHPAPSSDPGRPITPLLISIEQAAAALGVSRANLYEIMARGEIDTVRIGRRRLVRVRDLERYVDRLSDEWSR